jgi:hypothetical protein
VYQAIGIAVLADFTEESATAGFDKSPKHVQPHSHTAAEQHHLTHEFTLRCWPGQNLRYSQLPRQYHTPRPSNTLSHMDLSRSCGPSRHPQPPKRTSHTRTHKKKKQYLSMRDSPPISRKKPLPDAPIEQPPGLSLTAQAAVKLPQIPTYYGQPLSARAGRQAAERPRYSSKGINQRATAPEGGHGQHREAGLHHD